MDETSHLQHLSLTIGTSPTPTNLFRRQSEKPQAHLPLLRTAEMCLVRLVSYSTCGEEFDIIQGKCAQAGELFDKNHLKQYIAAKPRYCRYDRHPGCPAPAEQKVEADLDRTKEAEYNKGRAQGNVVEQAADRRRRPLPQTGTEEQRKLLLRDQEREQRAIPPLQVTPRSGQRRTRDQEEDFDDRDEAHEAEDRRRPQRKRKDNENSPRTRERKRKDKEDEDRRDRMRKDLWG